MTRTLVSIGCVLALGAAASAAPVRVRRPECASHGFARLTDMGGNPVATGELIQWPERGALTSRLVFRFDDGSLYDETVRFTQRGVFRVVAYHLIQRGPSFTETLDASFDRSGRYRVRRRAAPDADEKTEEGTTQIPDDVTNGMTSTLLKNLPPGAGATTHLLSFGPSPRVVELRLDPEGEDRYRIGAPATATRYRIAPHATGVTGAVATMIGKQPTPFHMWIAQGPAPVLVKFEGSLYADGPWWRLDLAAPTWEP